MRPDDSKHDEELPEIADLPTPAPVDATKDDATVKGGADIVSPRDPASGLPTGKRM